MTSAESLMLQLSDTVERLAVQVGNLLRRVEALEEAAAPAACSSPDFETFWLQYPRKVGKPYAQKAWASLGTASRKAALAAVGRFADIWAAAPADRKTFCPHPTTWLRGRRWEDGPDEWKRQAYGSNGKPAAVYVGTNPPSPGSPLERQDTDRWPRWMSATLALINHPSRPVVPDDLFLDYANWVNGKLPLNYEPQGWEAKVTAALAEVSRV